MILWTVAVATASALMMRFALVIMAGQDEHAMLKKAVIATAVSYHTVTEEEVA